jgi:mRNA-degrading endonuclease RelE of RelBE toxin-antitoxin system
VPKTAPVYIPRGFEWDRSIAVADQAVIVEQLLRLPAWADNQLGSDNLDVKKLADGDDLWRLRVGAYRAVFQLWGRSVVVHRIFRRKEDTDYRVVGTITLVRSAEGLRALAEDVEQPPPVPPSRKPVKEPARRDPVQNPLSVFRDEELADGGLSDAAITQLRRVPTELIPDRVLRRLDVEPKLIRLVAEMWEKPAAFVGKPLSVEAAALEEREAEERLLSEYSASSLLPIGDARTFLAMLDADIEDWMVYLHPSQASAVRRPVVGPSRVRGGAGTGKTVVALHRARYLANETGGSILLTTFVNNLPKIWERLLATFPDPIRGHVRCKTVNQIALVLYREAGGVREIADEAARKAILRDVWTPRRRALGGLTELGLADEFDHLIIGRGISDGDSYFALPRTGRGTPLARGAREVVWNAYEEYSTRMGKARLTFWPELRRDALVALRDGRRSLRFDAVVADEAQDLGLASVQMLAELVGGLPSPNLTLVGDGQQAIYPGGFSLLQTGIDVRGRATVLRTNWRNTYAIWMAARAFIEGEEFDDLDDDVLSGRSDEESPLPMRDGISPGLWTAGEGEDAALVAEIVREALELGVDPGDVGVLAPTNAQAKRLQAGLTEASVRNRELSRYEGVHEPFVRVGTFHRAKGLEFKHVVVTGLSAATWPPRRPGLDHVAQLEARGREVRAAFVAMTRARDRLDVVVAGEPASELSRAAWAFDRY